MKSFSPEILGEIEDILNIGIALSAEKDQNRLLEMIVSEARRITRADAGTLYLVDGDQLVFRIMQNESMGTFKGGDGEAIPIPPVHMNMENISAFVAITHHSVNIPDVYNAVEFDFSGPKKFDEATGYHTLSMLVIPLENHEGTVIGVLQLINAQDEDSNLIPFGHHFEKVVSSLASQAAIFLTNIQLLKDIENLFNSFVDVMATAIDSRTPYNANHSRRVALLAGELAAMINLEPESRWGHETFNKDRIAQLVMAGWLHDIGKIATPLEVMDKSSRIERPMELVMQRFDYIYSWLEKKYLEKKIPTMFSSKEEMSSLEQWWEDQKQSLEEARELVIKIDNPATFVDKELQEKITEVASRTYFDLAGNEMPWLKPDELTALCVVKGTLTDDERHIMEDHVVVTGRMLDKMPFTAKLKDVPHFAAIHHEHLNGHGYPNGLAGDDIPVEGRILALVDVFDALTADDRPYKKAMPMEQALKILGFMVKDQQLDGDLLEIFIKHQVWEKI
ncbi:MAG: HD domain-containing phosphohydrolase [Deltaproteobacteria bacterium]